MRDILVIDGVTYSTDPGLYFKKNDDGAVTASLQGNSGGFYQRCGITKDAAVHNLGAAMRDQVPSAWYDNLGHFQDFFKPNADT